MPTLQAKCFAVVLQFPSVQSVILQEQQQRFKDSCIDSHNFNLESIGTCTDANTSFSIEKPCKVWPGDSWTCRGIVFLFHGLQLCLHFGAMNGFNSAWSRNFKLALLHGWHCGHQPSRKRCRLACHLPVQIRLGKTSALATCINTTTEYTAQP